MKGSLHEWYIVSVRAAQLIELLSELQQGQVQDPIYRSSVFLTGLSVTTYRSFITEALRCYS